MYVILYHYFMYHKRSLMFCCCRFKGILPLALVIINYPYMSTLQFMNVCPYLFVQNPLSRKYTVNIHYNEK